MGERYASASAVISAYEPRLLGRDLETLALNEAPAFHAGIFAPVSTGSRST